MNKIEFNALAVAAKNDEAAAWEIKAKYMPLIEKLQIENWHKMNSETAFEDDCFRKLEYAIRTFDDKKGDFDKRAKALIYQSLKEYCGRRGNRRAVLSSLDAQIKAPTQDEVNATHYELFEDESVRVEERAIEEVRKQELVNDYSTNETDTQILNIILSAEGLITKSEVTRRLSAETGRTFNSARGVVRKFVERKKAALC